MELKGPLLVTLAYVAYYYAVQANLLRIKARLRREYAQRGEKFDRYFGHDRVMLAGDRVMLNTLEHMPPFLTLMWLHAIFVSPYGATVAGAIYVGARVLYPFLIGGRLGREVKISIMGATGFGYAVLLFFSGSLLLAAFGQ